SLVRPALLNPTTLCLLYGFSVLVGCPPRVLTCGCFHSGDTIMRFLLAGVAMLSFAATAALADPASDFKRADQALNQTFKQIQKRLADDSDGKARLVKAQRAWIAFRNAECTFQSSGDDGGSAAPMVAAACQAELTKARTRQLRAYLNCQEGDLSCPVPSE
ncbi:lysozyme inhibitor LprI family protein, partial [Mesorhizobium sp. M7A.F.Ca.ET.027.03.2.1]|uniref:lysozyme inhibitor LprI family protein n=1 Tax=Mesorhizobium sp. M7A.F.Ca.ET.027.03.2.1 TaxID=2496656 RepID=UPI0024784C13